MFIRSFEKIAFGMSPIGMGSLGGLVAGYSSGRSTASTTAGSLSSHGHKTRNEITARNIATVTAPAAAVVGLALMGKHKNKILPHLRKHLGNSQDMETVYHAALPVIGGAGGGIAGGATTGALMSLRGKFHKKKDKK